MATNFSQRSFLATVGIAVALCSCFNAPTPSKPIAPLSAHVIPSNGTPVSDAPEPEVVQLVKIENEGNQKHVTVGNVAGDYEIVCNSDANDAEKFGIHSCLSPKPQENYLLFRENTKWQINGAKEPISLKFFQDWSVSYNKGENVGLMPAAKDNGSSEPFGVYWLLSWKARSR